MRFFWIAVLLLTAAAAGAFYLHRDKAAPIVIVPAPASAEPIAAPPVKPEPAPIFTQAPVEKPAPIAAVPVPTPTQTPIASASPSSPSAAPQPTPVRTVPPKPEPVPAPPVSSDQPAPTSSPVPATETRPTPKTPPAAAVPEPTKTSAPSPATPANSPPAPKVEAPKPAIATPTPEAKAAAPAAKTPAAPASTDTTSDIASGLANLVGDGSTKPADTTAPTLPATTPTTTPAPAPASITTTSSKIKLEPQPDGTVLVDDKFIMKGKGTKDDPFRVTWEQLVSAQDTYQPRLGRKQIPERVKMLDGKWVRISGYIAFPLMAASADEMLMMLNQWDGCCIGVPPTPYDAIEVKLKTAAKGDSRLRTTGTLTGILRVDPYLVKDWLVSLFVMDDGEISETAGAAAQGQHAK